MSINVLLTIYMHGLNGTLLLNETSFCALSFSFTAVAKRSFVSLTTTHMHCYNHKNLILALDF